MAAIEPDKPWLLELAQSGEGGVVRRALSPRRLARLRRGLRPPVVRTCLPTLTVGTRPKLSLTLLVLSRQDIELCKGESLRSGTD